MKKIDYFPKPKTCPYCGSNVSYVNSEVLYGKDYGMIYLCDNHMCNSFVGVHKGTDVPMGILADSETRELRKLVHSLFDTTWRTINERTQMYKVLSRRMRIDKCHFGWMDKEQLERALKIVKRMKKKYQKRW